MGAYYHFTPNCNVQRILVEGIRPASQTGNRNTYFGIQGDPDYSYFWSSESTKAIAIFCTLFCGRYSPSGISIHTHTLLQVEIDDQDVERDYDQLLYLFYDKGATDEIESKIKGRAERIGVTVQEVSVEGIKKAIDLVPGDSWRKRPGSYRTSKIVRKVEVISWAQVTPARARLVGHFTRPVFDLWEIRKKW